VGLVFMRPPETGTEHLDTGGTKKSLPGNPIHGTERLAALKPI
jgi:hypothetical protein